MTAKQKILQLLADGAWTFGLDMVKRSDGVLKRGSVYVTLQQLEDAALVESRPDPDPDPRLLGARRVYRITEEGRREFQLRRRVR